MAIFFLARVIGAAVVVAGTRKARAVSAVDSPHNSRRVSATCASRYDGGGGGDVERAVIGDRAASWVARPGRRSASSSGSGGGRRRCARGAVRRDAVAGAVVVGRGAVAMRLAPCLLRGVRAPRRRGSRVARTVAASAEGGAFPTVRVRRRRDDAADRGPRRRLVEDGSRRQRASTPKSNRRYAVYSAQRIAKPVTAATARANLSAGSIDRTVSAPTISPTASALSELSTQLKILLPVPTPVATFHPLDCGRFSAFWTLTSRWPLPTPT